ncbi:hypothetical protein [Streptomyces sp. NPDC047968]|uniref:hypothetical protein n=1 Tax=unclassified Streptomyces TaxID=2593676 RepID=UPI003422C462
MPADHDVTHCPSCLAPIRWTVTAAARRMAVNATPDPAGNVAVHTDGTGRVRSRALTRERPTLEHHEWKAMPHAATCTAPPRRRTGRPGARARQGVRPVPWRQR